MPKNTSDSKSAAAAWRHARALLKLFANANWPARRAYKFVKPTVDIEVVRQVLAEPRPYKHLADPRDIMRSALRRLRP